MPLQAMAARSMDGLTTHRMAIRLFMATLPHRELLQRYRDAECAEHPDDSPAVDSVSRHKTVIPGRPEGDKPLFSWDSMGYCHR